MMPRDPYPDEALTMDDHWQFHGNIPPADSSVWSTATPDHEHEHLHLFGNGLRSFIHSHPHPQDEDDPLAARPHQHVNGSHRHPHGHDGYALLPDDERRPIIAAGTP